MCRNLSLGDDPVLDAARMSLKGALVALLGATIVVYTIWTFTLWLDLNAFFEAMQPQGPIWPTVLQASLYVIGGIVLVLIGLGMMRRK